MNRPVDTVNQLVEAMNRGDVDGALSLYEPDAVLMVQPGQLVRGSAQVREALSGFIALKAVVQSEAQQVIEAGDVALYVSRWTLRGVDPAGKAIVMGGESADVLRRQPDDRWWIVVDNPWGTGILG